MDFNKQIENLKDELITSVQEIIKIKSVEKEGKPGKPFGDGVAAALDYALKLADSMGFKTTNLDGYVGYAEYGEGSDYIAILGHLDVVPEESGWIYPAYGGEIHDGRIYGRGAVDDKGPTIAALYALKVIKDLNLALSTKVRIIFGTNEETGCHDMEYYVQKEKPPLYGFTPDGDYPVIQGEKGTIKLNIIKEIKRTASSVHQLTTLKAGERLNIVPDYCIAKITTENADEVLEVCKAFITESGFNIEAARDDDSVMIEAFGKAAHGSTPELGENAIMNMLALLGKFEFGSSDINSVISYLNKYIANETNGQSLGIGLKDEASGSLTLNIGKITLEDNRIIVGCDIRFPVTFKLQDVIEQLSLRCNEAGMSLEVFEDNEPLYFPKDHCLISILNKVFNEQTNLVLSPKTIGGGTYAKYLSNTVAYGTIMPGKPHVEHQANEYIEIEDLLLDAKIYAHAIYELAK